METKTFDTDSIKGLRAAESYKRKLENKYNKVTVSPVGVNRVRITGESK